MFIVVIYFYEDWMGVYWYKFDEFYFVGKGMFFVVVYLV